MIAQDDFDSIANAFSYGFYPDNAEVELITQRYLNFYGPAVIDHREESDIQRFLGFYEQVMPRYRLPYRGQFQEKTTDLLRAFCAKLPDVIQREAPVSPVVPYRLKRQWWKDAIPDNELDRLFTYLDQPAMFFEKMLIELILGTGCDLRDLSKITFSDIDLYDGKILIRANPFNHHYVAIGPRLRIDILRYLSDYRTETNSEAELFTMHADRDKKARELNRIVLATVGKLGINKPQGDGWIRLRMVYNDQFFRLGGNERRMIENLGEAITPGDDQIPPHPRMTELISLNSFVYRKSLLTKY